MSNVPVQQVSGEKSLPASWLDELQKFTARVQRRAFELFESEGHKHGRQLDHWLEAEKQELSGQSLALINTADEIEVRLCLPDFKASELEVSALPDALLVKAETSLDKETTEEGIHSLEYRNESFFRKVALPQAINVERVTAKFERGILCIVAQKAAIAKKKEEQRHVATAAAA